MRTECRSLYTDTHSHAHFVSVFSFQTHLDALRTLSALLWFKVGLSKSLHEVILADMPYLRATETTFTTWTSCDQLAHILLRVNFALSGGSVPHTSTFSCSRAPLLVRSFTRTSDHVHSHGEKKE